MTDELKNWWDEDAERLNRLSARVAKAGKLIKVGPTKPIELNPDGSEKIGLPALVSKLSKPAALTSADLRKNKK